MHPCTITPTPCSPPRFPSSRPTEDSETEFGAALVRFATEEGCFKRAAHTRLHRYGDVYTLHLTALLFCAATIIVGDLWRELPVAETNYFASTKMVKKWGAAGREEAAFVLCGCLLDTCTRFPSKRQNLSSCVVAPSPHAPTPLPASATPAPPSHTLLRPPLPPLPLAASCTTPPRRTSPSFASA